MQGWWRLISLAMVVIACGIIDWLVGYIWPELYYPDVCAGAFIVGFFFLWMGAHFERLDMRDQKREKAASVEYADWD